MALTHKDLPAIDVKDCRNGEAELLITQGHLEFGVRLGADQVDDLQAALEEVSQSLEEYHRAQEFDGYTERAWRQ